MINSSEWKEFRIGDIFAVNGSKTTSKIELEKIGDGKYPYVTTQATNNGIAGYYNFYTEIGNCLTIDSAVLGSCFYQKENFSASDHVEILRPKNFNLNSKLALYFTSLLNKNIDILGYSYTKKRNQIRIKNEIVKLPVNNLGKIDFEFMENFIDKIEQKQRGILEFYKHKKQNRGGYELNSRIWKEFKIGDLFISKTGDTDLQQKDINGKGEYFLNSGYANCGVNGKTDRPARIFSKNTITIDFLGYVFYRNFEYKMATHNHIFSLSGEVIKNERIGLFLVSTLSYLKNLFSFSNMGTWTKFKDLKIKLPVTTSGGIDFEFMESFIKAISKECIKGVDSYLAKNIVTTKELIK